MSDGQAQEEPCLKIAIVGKAPSSQGLAPFADPDWEIWTCSDIPFTKEVPKWDRHFEIHDAAYVKQRHSGGGYWKWLTEYREPKPLYLKEKVPAIPGGIAYPVADIVRDFGRYFTNSVSWMIAYAISLKPHSIGLWGVDMACQDEYRAQRASCEYFIGLAAGCGIEIFVPGGSDLLKCRTLYGFEDDSPFEQKFAARTAELQGRVNQLSQQRDNLSLQTAYMEGALSAQEWYAQWLRKQG